MLEGCVRCKGPEGLLHVKWGASEACHRFRATPEPALHQPKSTRMRLAGW